MKLARIYSDYCFEHGYYCVASDLRDREWLLKWVASQPLRWLKERYVDETLELDEFERILDLKFGLAASTAA